MVFGIDVLGLIVEVPPVRLLLYVAILANAMLVGYSDARAVEPPTVVAKRIQRSPETFASFFMRFSNSQLHIHGRQPPVGG